MIEGENKKKLEELIKFHDKYDDKVRDMVSFTVDVHPTYKDTRCFQVVKKDGSKQDFSFTKCVARI